MKRRPARYQPQRLFTIAWRCRWGFIGRRQAVAVVLLVLLASVWAWPTFGLAASRLETSAAGEAAVASPARAAAGSPDRADQARDDHDDWERRRGGYYTVRRSPGDQALTATALELQPGDLYIDERNQRYQVLKVDPDKDVIWVRYEGPESLPQIDEKLLIGLASDLLGTDTSGLSGAAGKVPMTPSSPVPARWRGRQAPLIGIYFTHSDESYRPTSGSASRLPRGDIYEVGRRLADGLRRQGLRVDLREDTHAPHDGLAYLRSRSTARQLLLETPVALIDVHRDATPAHVYQTTVQGRAVAKVRIVVGRQTPQFAANFDFAKRLKAVADRLFPGLVAGIFAGHGTYNQDMGPRSTLLEFGTYSLPLDQAATAADLFSRVIPVAAGLTPGVATPETYGGWRGIKLAFGILAVVGVGAFLFLALNRHLPRRT